MKFFPKNLFQNPCFTVWAVGILCFRVLIGGFRAFQLWTSSTRSICSMEPSRTSARRRAAPWCLLAQSKSLFLTLLTGCSFGGDFPVKNLRLAEMRARIGRKGCETEGFELLLKGVRNRKLVFLVCVYICLFFPLTWEVNWLSKLFLPLLFFFLKWRYKIFMCRHSIRAYQNLPCRYSRNLRCLDKNPCALLGFLLMLLLRHPVIVLFPAL